MIHEPISESVTWWEEKKARPRPLLAAGRLWERYVDGTERLSDAVRRGHGSVGRHTYGNPIVRTYNGINGRIDVGSFVSFARAVEVLLGGEHRPSWVSAFPLRVSFNAQGKYRDGQPSTGGRVQIGSDVWIGTRALIMSGITIGHGAIVAAGAVVTKNVAPYSIVGGVPATPIRMRFSEETIEALIEIAWWEWPDSAVMEAIPILSSEDVSGFIRRYGV